MKFEVPSDFCELPSGTKEAVLRSAEKALGERKEVFFQKKKFTNFDELKSNLIDHCKLVTPEADWNGEITG